MLHDSITGDLSLIMLAASGPEQTDKDKDLILSLSQEALRKTHAVIELLEENRHQTETPALCHGSDIRNLCREKMLRCNKSVPQGKRTSSETRTFPSTMNACN